MPRSIRWIMMLLIVLCTIALAACGGGTEVPAASAPTEGATSAPVELPTSAPVEPPTSVPSELPTSAPVATEAAPETIVAPTAMVSPPATGSTACNNAYYPLRQGATWTYTIAGMTAPIEQVHTITSVQDATVELTIQTGGTVAITQITCTDEGLKFGSLPSISSQGGLTGQFETQSVEGSYLLASDRMVPGATWDTRYVIVGKMTVGQQELAITQEVTLHSQVIGSESVTVAAGTFDALKIAQQLILNTTAQGAPMAMPAITIDQQSWYAHDVGLIKSTTTMSGVPPSSTELKSYTLP